MARTAVEAYFQLGFHPARPNACNQLFSPAIQICPWRLRCHSRFSTSTRPKPKPTTPLALIQYLDLKTYLVGDINTKVDRASMAHSLEVREPLMDHELIEWLATLQSSKKIRGQETKYLLKKSMEPHLPNDVLYRPKMGFSVPLARWFRGPLKQRVQECAARKSSQPKQAGSIANYLQHHGRRSQQRQPGITVLQSGLS
jgi:asparagine synthase (glutamine-hydrolysing)